MDPGIFIELSKILIITLIVAGVVKLLKQPLIIGYIISGIIVGPFVLNMMISTSTVATFSQIGVALLLFMVGLGLNPKVIKDVGKISLITGLGQVFFTSLVGYFIAILLGFSRISAMYVGLALAFSSTIIIMKLLSDKRDLETLYGKISIGFLIVQDVVAIIVLLAISSIGNNISLSIGGILTHSFFRGMLIIAIFTATTMFVLPYLIKHVAKSQEFLLLFSAGWCFAVSAVFYYLNLSIEAGALIAGIALSTTPYSHQIGAKMKTLRDFFLIMFFILLGAQMVFSNVLEHAIPIVIFSIFILVGNPIIVMSLMGYFGYTKRNSFLAGLTVAQISEFSLILIALGISVGHLSGDMISFMTAVGLVTFAGSTYMIIYSDKIYPFVSRYISIFERKGKKVDAPGCDCETKYDAILIGYNRVGFDVLESLKKIKKNFLIIDYNPDTIVSLVRNGFHCKYGDVNDSEFLSDIDFSKTKMIISTIPVLETNMFLAEKVRHENKNAALAVVSHEIDDALKLYRAGVTYVIMPHFLGGKHFSGMLEDHKLSKSGFLKEKSEHITNLKKRKSLGQEHPEHERM